MVSDRLHEKITKWIRFLQAFADRAWYPPLVGLLAGLDNFIIVVPTDGILISSSMLQPRRWILLALNVALGSTVGALMLAAAVELQGLPWILEMYPGIEKTASWAWAVRFFETYGLLLVFAVAVTPLVQQPVVIMAGLADTSLTALAGVIFVGRLIKYLILSYVGSHTPRLLGRMWGLKDELKEAGVKIPD